MSKTNKILIILGLLVVFGLGWAIGKSTQPVSPQLSQADIEKKLIQDLSQKLAEKQKKGLLPFKALPGATKEKMTSLTGEIISKDVQKGLLKVKIDNPYREGDLFAYLQEPDYYQKQIIVGNDTEIVKLKPKEMKELPKPGEINPEELSPFEEIKLSLKDLKEGESVNVESQAEFKLEENKPIEAKKITVR